MEDRHFDSLVKSLATGRNRRAFLKGLLGLGAAAVAGTTSAANTGAARRPTPTPKPVRCPGNQIWDGTACVCPSGTLCGAECCTGEAVCCDNACCNGECYGEELCCPFGSFVCDGECLPYFEGACCTDDDCSEGEACVAGTCQPTCAENDASCGADADCCSGICQAGVCYETIGGTCPADANYCAGQNAVFCNGTFTCYCTKLSDGTSVCMDGPLCAPTCSDCPEGSLCDGATNCCGEEQVTCIVPCPPDGGSCFSGDTLIALADGSSRPIADIREGDLVLGDDGGVNRVLAVETPILGDRPLYRLDDGTAFVTGSHPFQTDDGWKAIDPALTYRDHHLPGVGRLSVGDRLVMLAGVLIPAGHATGSIADPIEIRTEPRSVTAIVSVQSDPETQLYNLQLDGNHTYFANDLLVHNK
jgi:hypothetical protein